MLFRSTIEEEKKADHAIKNGKKAHQPSEEARPVAPSEPRHYVFGGEDGDHEEPDAVRHPAKFKFPRSKKRSCKLSKARGRLLEVSSAETLASASTSS